MKMIKYLFLFFSTLIFAQVTTEEFSVYFETDSYTLTTESTDKIEAVLNTKTGGITDIFLTGYCDDRGSIDYNKKLALSRIWSIVNYLKPRYSYGAFNEVAIGEIPLENSNNIKKQRAQNRRVDLSINFEVEETIEEIVTAPDVIVKDTIEQYRSYDILKDSMKVGDKIVFNNVIFHPGRHKLRESSFPVMDSIINSLLLHKKYEIEIQGHICCLAAGIYGRDMDTGQWNLSQARAEQVKRFLVRYGVAANRLTTTGKQANFKTGKGDYYDRRVEIHITAVREEKVEE